MDARRAATSTSTAENGAEGGRVGADTQSGAVVMTATVPVDGAARTGQMWAALRRAAALPLLVGGAFLLVHGEISWGLFRRAWPVLMLLVPAYVCAWGLSVELEQFPFIGQWEATLVSVGATLVPAGGVVAIWSGSVLSPLALCTTAGSIGGYLADRCLHRRRTSRRLLVSGSVTDRLLGVPGVSRLEKYTEVPVEALDGVVAASRSRRAGHILQGTAAERRAGGGTKSLPTYPSGDLYERLTARVPLRAGARIGLDLRTPRYYPYVKRVLDLLLIGLSVPVTVPLAVLIALAIRLESRGPVLFWQERVGQGGEPFQMVKFRSMRVGNEGETEALFARESDDRVTTVGRVLRTLRLDELPQFWNVLKGEMSLIGPRPEQVGLAENFDDDLALYHARHRVPPGITGWAQVLHGYAADEDETRRKLEHDLYYVKHRSIGLDLLIVYLTVKTILTGFGAR